MPFLSMIFMKTLSSWDRHMYLESSVDKRDALLVIMIMQVIISNREFAIRIVQMSNTR